MSRRRTSVLHATEDLLYNCEQQRRSSPRGRSRKYLTRACSSQECTQPSRLPLGLHLDSASFPVAASSKQFQRILERILLSTNHLRVRRQRALTKLRRRWHVALVRAAARHVGRCVRFRVPQLHQALETPIQEDLRLSGPNVLITTKLCLNLSRSLQPQVQIDIPVPCRAQRMAVEPRHPLLVREARCEWRCALHRHGDSGPHERPPALSFYTAQPHKQENRSTRPPERLAIEFAISALVLLNKRVDDRGARLAERGIGCHAKVSRTVRKHPHLTETCLHRNVVRRVPKQPCDVTPVSW